MKRQKLGQEIDIQLERYRDFVNTQKLSNEEMEVSPRRIRSCAKKQKFNQERGLAIKRKGGGGGQVSKGLVGRAKIQVNNVARSVGQLGNQGDQVEGQYGRS